MKIAMLTMFRTLVQTYSLVHVVEEQLKILLDKGHDIKLIVSQGCVEEERYGIYLDERIKWVKIVNVYNDEIMTWHDYSEGQGVYHETFEEEVACIATELSKALEDREVCLIHDILFQGKHYVHNCALRKAKNHLPDMGCIAFIHSWPIPTHLEHIDHNRFLPLEHTIYSFPTYCGIPSLAKQYKIQEGMCRVVSHTVPIEEQMTELVQRLHKQYDLLSPDIIVVYPARLTEGKGIHQVVKLVGAIKCVGNMRVKLILCDSGTTQEAIEYKETIKSVAGEYGVNVQEIIFLSEVSYATRIDRQDILALFQLSDLYICPSQSESFGLGVIEAARAGNLIVLNENVPALRELGRQVGAYFMKWDSRGDNEWHTQLYPEGEAVYYGREAKRLIEHLNSNTISVGRRITRQKFNREWMYTQQLECLLRECHQLCKL